jgi:Zn-dependent peptidase ImmA (M78 family)/transcriptional regulator with XRE-family HTH domain
MSVGGQIANARKSAGLTQQDLAAKIARDASAISRIEHGLRRVSSYELAAIADALAVHPSILLGTAAPRPAMTLAARVGQEIDSGETSSALKRLRRLLEIEGLLDEIGVEPIRRRAQVSISPPADLSPIEAGIRLAAEARLGAGLGTAPLGPDMSGLLEEQFGVDVILEPLPEGIDGLCIRAGDRTFAIARSDALPGRQRFTLAHELGHHVSGDQDFVIEERERTLKSRSAREQRANAFAIHFLMPEQHVRDRWQKTDLHRTAVDLMLEFGVSFRALVFHLHNLRLINSHQRDSLCNQSAQALAFESGRSSDWKAFVERTPVRRVPTHLELRALSAYRQGRIGIGPLADLYAAEDAEKLREGLHDMGIQPDPAEIDIRALL